MRGLTIILLAAVSIAGIQAWADGPSSKPRKIDPKAAKITYTLIADAGIHTFNNLSCDLVVLMALDRQSVKIARVEPPTGTIDATYVVMHPEAAANAGINVNLANEFDLRARKVKSVRAQINFDDRERNVILVAVLETGEELVKTRSVDAEFFRDHADHCLK
jgi:hypothetical protein